MRYLLIGESPYPRRESANGIAFYDAAVGELWSDRGLSKAVNRATSLRNIVKTALLGEGLLQRDADGKITQDAIARLDKSGLIQTLPELFDNLASAGFLMLNATPVLHPERKPAVEARLLAGLPGTVAGPDRATIRTTDNPVAVGQDCKPCRTTCRPARATINWSVSTPTISPSSIIPTCYKLFARLRVLQMTSSANCDNQKR